MLVIGLTGLIGSGKTTVANLFAQLGAKIIDTDVIAHQLTAKNGAALALISAEFGYEILNPAGELNRARLRELVFNDDQQRERLEQLLHPLIFAAVQQEMLVLNNPSYIMLVVPLLFRSPKYLALTKRNIFVDCDYLQLVQRLAVRSNLTQAQVDAILAQQVNRAEQLALADDIIENNGDTQNLIAAVKSLHQQYLLLR
jgi:dephospho-CoA kinase